MLADRYPNFSICGLPYFLSGDVPDWQSLAHRTIDDLEDAGIELLLEHTATPIDPPVRTSSPQPAATGHERPSLRLADLDRRNPVRPPIPGLEPDGVYQLHTMDDSFVLAVRSPEPERAVIVGAGYIGLEMAEALHARGLAVTVVEQLADVLPTVDLELGALVRTSSRVMASTFPPARRSTRSNGRRRPRCLRRRRSDRRGRHRARRRRRQARHASRDGCGHRDRGARRAPGQPAGWKPPSPTSTRPAIAS